MATKSNSMFRISQLAKDLGVKPKELQGKLEEMLPMTTQLGSFERQEDFESGYLI